MFVQVGANVHQRATPNAQRQIQQNERRHSSGIEFTGADLRNALSKKSLANNKRTSSSSSVPNELKDHNYGPKVDQDSEETQLDCLEQTRKMPRGLR